MSTRRWEKWLVLNADLSVRLIQLASEVRFTRVLSVGCTIGRCWRCRRFGVAVGISTLKSASIYTMVVSALRKIKFMRSTEVKYSGKTLKSVNFRRLLIVLFERDNSRNFWVQVNDFAFEITVKFALSRNFAYRNLTKFQSDQAEPRLTRQKMTLSQ